jgi:hypothetical protein
MTLTEFSQLAVAITSILFSIVLLMVMVSFSTLYKRINKILDQLEVMAHTGLETSRTVREYIDKTTASLSAITKNFVTIRGATELVSYIGDAIKHSRTSKQGKEPEYGSEPTQQQ